MPSPTSDLNLHPSSLKPSASPAALNISDEELSAVKSPSRHGAQDQTPSFAASAAISPATPQTIIQRRSFTDTIETVDTVEPGQLSNSPISDFDELVHVRGDDEYDVEEEEEEEEDDDVIAADGKVHTYDKIGRSDEIVDEDDYEDEEEDENESQLYIPSPIEVADFQAPGGRHPLQSRSSITSRFSRSDANSIVGGESFKDLDDPSQEDVLESNEQKQATSSSRHPISDESKPTQDQPKATAGYTGSPNKAQKPESFNDSQKVFSFSLPFGGFSTIRSNLYKQIQSFKQDSHLPSFPTLNSLSFNKTDTDEHLEEIRLRLQRQQSVSTVDEAKYFLHQKGTDAVRFRAVKQSISSNINEMLPDFMHAKKEKEKEKPPYESIYNDIDGNIVLLGGYRGSILRDTRTHKRVWIPLKAGFNLRKINLLLGPSQKDEIKALQFIYPDGVLKNIGPIDICKKLLKKLDANPKTNVQEFGYDWRLSLSISASQLLKVLQKNYSKTGKPTLIIAHSMGGLVAHLVLQQRPDLIRGIVYVGVPSECLNILGPIRFGDSVLFSDKILTYETNFMMRSSFAFLPLSGRVFVNKDTKECYDLDYFNPDTWVEYNLNPLVSKKRILHELGSEANSSAAGFSPMSTISSKIRNYRSLSIGRKNKSGSVSPSRNVDSSTGLDSDSNLISKSSSQTAVDSNVDVSRDHGIPDTSKSPSVLTGANAMQPPGLPASQLPPSTSSTTLSEVHHHYSYTFTEAYNYLAETLKLAKEFILSLDYRPELETKYPPLAVVYGNKVPSVRGSNVRGIQDIKDGNYYEFFYGHGDGVVHRKWLMPEKKGFSLYDEKTGEGQIVGKFSSVAGHVNLMTDFEAMGNALYAIVEAERTWHQKKHTLASKAEKMQKPERTFNVPVNLPEIIETD